MIDYRSFSKFSGIALIGYVMAGTLLGCQPTTEETPIATEDTSDADHAMHSEEEHDMHSEDEHSDAMEANGEHAGDEHSGDDHAEVDHSGHDHASKSAPFNCEPTATIGVYYHSDGTPQTAHLLIDGIEYDLSATSDSADTASQTYTSDIGLDNTSGLIWQVTGDKATLYNKTLDADVAIENETVLFNCSAP